MQFSPSAETETSGLCDDVLLSSRLRKFDEVLNALPPDKREGAAALAGLKYWRYFLI